MEPPFPKRLKMWWAQSSLAPVSSMGTGSPGDGGLQRVGVARGLLSVGFEAAELYGKEWAGEQDWSAGRRLRSQHCGSPQLSWD